jgi:hypothetical protein
MYYARFYRLAAALICLVFLSGCAVQRTDDAAAAKSRMIGLSREEVLACMGPAKKKAHEGTTEVWSYLSTDGRSDSNGDLFKTTNYAHANGSHERSFCTVNVVMKDGIVSAIHYNGPTSTYFFSQDDQCGFAVANCVPH